MQNSEAAVLGAEIMAPLADAMRFVNGKQTEKALGIQRIELRQKAGCVDALWGSIQKRDVAFAQALFDGTGFVWAERGV